MTEQVKMLTKQAWQVTFVSLKVLQKQETVALP